MIFASVDTSHFAFVTIARTSDDAARQLRAAWRRHRRDYPDADPAFMEQLLTDGEVRMAPIEVGVVLRDGEPL